jgi:hypothetical protein
MQIVLIRIDHLHPQGIPRPDIRNLIHKNHPVYLRTSADEQ